MNMRKLTEEEAIKLSCPKSFDNKIYEHGFKCKASKCFAWYEVDSRIEREDHSGSKEMMYNEGVERRQKVKREGPSGCTGILILEARGTCGLIYPEIKRRL